MNAPSASESPLDRMLRVDPALRTIFRLRLNPFLVALIVAGYGVVHTLALPAWFGHLHTAGGIPGALDDWPNLVIILLLVPIIAGYYVWQPSVIQATYAAVAGRAGLVPAAATRAAMLMRPLGWQAWPVIAILVALLGCASEVVRLSNQTLLTWQNANWAMIASRLPLRFAAFYAIVFLVVRQTVILFGLNRFFVEFSVEIQPLHPDRAGGLRMLGDYVLSNGLLIGVVGLILGMQLVRSNAGFTVLTGEFYSELAVYFLAAPTLFFLFPLYSAHTRMVEAKQRLLAEISEQFDVEYRALLASLRQNVLKLEEVERLDAIQKIYSITQASPDWPFDARLASKYGAAVVLPILAPLGVDLLARLLLK